MRMVTCMEGIVWMCTNLYNKFCPKEDCMLLAALCECMQCLSRLHLHTAYNYKFVDKYM